MAGARRDDGYNPVDDAISRLASADAPDPGLMTAGLVAFGLLVPAFAVVLGRALRSRFVALTCATAGLATFGVALAPLSAEGGQPVDTLHGLAAGVGYLALAATPAAAARRLPGGPARTASYAVAVLSAVALSWSVVGEPAGLLQRTGLGVVDLWLVVAACVLARSVTSSDARRRDLGEAQ